MEAKFNSNMFYQNELELNTVTSYQIYKFTILFYKVNVVGPSIHQLHLPYHYHKHMRLDDSSWMIIFVHRVGAKRKMEIKISERIDTFLPTITKKCVSAADIKRRKAFFGEKKYR